MNKIYEMWSDGVILLRLFLLRSALAITACA
eukprot:SAG31_NODE_4713_length_3014_cov_13.907033_4_plen_31_part_00